MNDWISIEGLSVDALIGVYAHEALIHQRLRIDLRLKTDIAPAARDDDVKQTIDYDAVAQIAREVATSRHHRLIETIAEDIAQAVLQRFAVRLYEVNVRVQKPGAVPDAVTVAVEITRRRP